MVMNNEAVTIMQKVAEMKEWQQQCEGQQKQNQMANSPRNETQGDHLLDFSSPSTQLKTPADNLKIVDLDNGIHMIDELLNRIQRQSTEAPRPSTPPSHSLPSPSPYIPSFSPPSVHQPRILQTARWEPVQASNVENTDLLNGLDNETGFHDRSPERRGHHADIHREEDSRPEVREVLATPLDNDVTPVLGAKPKQPFLKRGQGLSRYRMTISDLKKLPLKPAPGRKKPATRPVAVPDKRASTRTLSSSRSETLSKAALNHLETWSNVFGKNKEIVGPNSQLTKGQPSGFRSNRSVESNPHASTVAQMSPLTQMRSEMALDLERRKREEMEEQKVFDILEQKTKDSSFTSTSSMVARLMEDSVMSTPVKMPSGPDVEHAGMERCSQDRCRTIEEVDETASEGQSVNGFTIEQLPRVRDTEPDCSCDSDTDTRYCSSDEETPDTPTVDEAIRNYKPVLNKPYIDAGKTGAVTYSQLEEYLKLCQPLRSLPLSHTSANKSSQAVQTSNNAVVKETKELLANMKRLAEERQRQESAMEDKENEREKSLYHGKSKRQIKKPNFPMTVYQETYQKHAAKANSKKSGLKSFGSEDPEPNPFEQKSESVLNLDLLKKRLGDLENEIHVFRLENIKLNKERKEFEKDRAAFARTKKSSEKSLEEEKAAFQREMEEERSKLNKEKKVFLKYAKEAKNFPSRPEREELAKVRSELQSLKEDAVKKETKWAASQARLRNHIKVLETQNQELKIQVEKLGKEAKKVSFASKKHISNTQIMNAINSQISKLTKTDVLPPVSILKKPAAPQPAVPTVQSPGQNPKEAPSSYNLTLTSNPDIPMPEDSFDRVIYQNLFNGEKSVEDKNADNEEVASRDDSVIPIESLYLGPSTEYKEIITADGTKEKHFPDGRKEFHYTNGNTMIISEAGKYIKMLYNNGDIKETDTADQTVRYFYSENNTWHTTHADGTEVLEFSNGQTETRHRDGSKEVEYSNGCHRTIRKDGTELWRFDSGPVETVESGPDGTRTLSLRNGQREIHTRHHKRREFPDGTVKMVYPDGIQETRYPNGRIRLKDTQGNLIMDSHQE